MTWVWIFIAGIVTFLTRFSMVAFINPRTLSNNTKKVLTYVPSAVFPAIIFPAVFFDKQGLFLSMNHPQILAFSIAIILGYLFKNIILTIFSGLISYWVLIFWLS
jgi:branched-subunit amino acid transport protein